MSDGISLFQARDAFTYVDLYRRLKVESADYVTKQRQRLVERFWNVQEATPRYWAELRAHEHALDWIMHRREPGLVVLGETDEAGNPPETAEAAATKRRVEELRQCREENSALARQIQQFQQLEHEFQATLVQKNQEIARVERKLSQTQSTSAVVGLTLVAVILIQFGLLLTG